MQIQMIPIGQPEQIFKDTAKVFVVIEQAVRNEVVEGVRFMSVYPPAPPNSRYVRTGILRRSWNFKVVTGGGRIEGVVGSQSNIAPYNEEVQGSPQGNIFRDIGWRNTDDLQKQIDTKFADKVQAEISKYFD